MAQERQTIGICMNFEAWIKILQLGKMKDTLRFFRLSNHVARWVEKDDMSFVLILVQFL